MAHRSDLRNRAERAIKHDADILQIGLFFDGTRNNANNLRNSQHQGLAQAQAQSKQTSADDDPPYQSPVNSSWTNGLTNIARLHALYPDRRRDPHAGASIALYIEGPGTRDGQPDDLLGLAFGTGISGVQTKIEQLLAERLPQALQSLSRVLERPVSGLRIDLFGYSRGAAAARELANRLAEWNTSQWQGLLREAGVALAPSFVMTRPVARFIGLFDTVVAVNATAQEHAPRQWLAPGIADKVLQLAARDEHRLHFALTSVAPEHEQRLLPGSHADIGGGLAQTVEGPKLLSRPRSQRIHAYPFAPMETPSRAWLHATDSHRRTQADAERWRAKLQLGTDAIWVDTWHRWQHQRSAGSSSVLPDIVLYVYSAVVLRRTMDLRYPLITLRIMHAAATAVGVRWATPPDALPELSLPAELEEIALRMLQQQPLSSQQETLLKQRFLTQSAHWNFDALGNTELIHASDTAVTRLPYRPGPGLLYINRPTDDGHRVVLRNA